MSTRKLLLADDSITIQKVVNLTFADEGIEVIAVGSGDAAMEKMAEIAPDLVMADINMPGLTGYQVCERIKQDENSKNTPVILLVGSFEPFDEAEARRVGADDFLTKPFQSIRQLVSKVTVLLDANDKSAANLYDATANNSFADTLEMNEPEITNSDQANELGDAGMDDEMIQAAPVNSFALDESAKFETKDFASYEALDDDKKTQPLSVYDLKEFSFVAGSPEKENEVEFSENTNVSEPQDFQSFSENNFVESEPDHFAENKSGEIEEDNSQLQNFVEGAGTSQPDVQDFYESVLEESKPDNQRKEDFSAFFNSSEDDDFLEIPFDEDEEWETTENAEQSENNSTETTEPTSLTQESEQTPPVETEEGKAEGSVAEQDQITEESEQTSSFDNKEEKTEESFAEQEPATEENEQISPVETEEQSAEEDDSLIEELPQPESFEETQEETPTQNFYESEQTEPHTTGEETQTQDFSDEHSTVEFNSEFQNQESDSKNVAEESGDENSSSEAAEEVSQEETSENEEYQPEYAESSENYHGENEVVVGSLIEPENKETKAVNEEEKAGNPVENQSSTEPAAQFSPEVIDAIARRVVEMLSEKVVREIAWEVVPQHADLVIKKAVEEKLAEEKLTE